MEADLPPDGQFSLEILQFTRRTLDGRHHGYRRTSKAASKSGIWENGSTRNRNDKHGEMEARCGEITDGLMDRSVDKSWSRPPGPHWKARERDLPTALPTGADPFHHRALPEPAWNVPRISNGAIVITEITKIPTGQSCFGKTSFCPKTF